MERDGGADPVVSSCFEVSHCRSPLSKPVLCEISNKVSHWRLDKKNLIYKEKSNFISTRPFGMETKSKTTRACLKPKVDNIVLIGQYRVVNEFNKSQYWYQNTRLTKICKKTKNSLK